MLIALMLFASGCSQQGTENEAESLSNETENLSNEIETPTNRTEYRELNVRIKKRKLKVYLKKY
jgi:outer membrane lipoprotein-sorting protein